MQLTGVIDVIDGHLSGLQTVESTTRLNVRKPGCN